MPHRVIRSALLGGWALSFATAGCGGGRPPERGPDPSSSRPTEPYPAWFLQTPGGGERPLAVGYAPAYETPENAFREAREDALRNLAMGVRVRIRGEHAFESVVEGTAYRGSNIKESVEESILESLAEDVAYLDSTVVNGTTLVLAGTALEEVVGTPSVPEEPPAWIRSLPSAPGYDHAMGSCVPYFYPRSSWAEAERQARIQLALTRDSRLGALSSLSDRHSRQVTVEGTDVLLSGFQVIARYHDPRDGGYYVLARCRSNVPVP